MSLGEAVVTLPSLNPKVSYNGMPRRYEETKPVLVRDLTHRRILDMGLSFHEKTLAQCSYQQSNAVALAESAVWKEADIIKCEAVKQAQDKAQREHEKLTRKIVKAHDKTLKDEVKRVCDIKDRQRVAAVQQEKEAGDERLAEAVRAAQQKCHEELVAAVLQARQEEQQSAERKAIHVENMEKEKFNNAMETATNEKILALKVLEAEKNAELAVALAELRKTEQADAAMRLSHMQNSYEGKLSDLRNLVDSLRAKISSQQDELMSVTTHRRLIVQELVETRHQYQKFIDKTNPFEKGKSDYMIPPIKTVDLDSLNDL